MAVNGTVGGVEENDENAEAGKKLVACEPFV